MQLRLPLWPWKKPHHLLLEIEALLSASLTAVRAAAGGAGEQ